MFEIGLQELFIVLMSVRAVCFCVWSGAPGLRDLQLLGVQRDGTSA